MQAFHFAFGSPRVLKDVHPSLEEEYEMGEELGRGVAGVVKSCRSRSTGETLACKTIRKSDLLCEADRERIRREVQVMQLLNGHPNIVSLVSTFEDRQQVHLVMELCEGGEMYDAITRRCFPEPEAARLFVDIVNAVAHCHAHCVLHRDIKPENILLSCDDDTVSCHGHDFAETQVPDVARENSGVDAYLQDRSHDPLQDDSSTVVPPNEQSIATDGLRLKLADFGLAIQLDSPNATVSGIAGSPYYLAPEVLEGSYGLPADMWSLGVILYILLSGTAPFSGDTEDEILAATKLGEWSFGDSSSSSRSNIGRIWRTVSEEAKDLIRCLLYKDPTSRPSAADVLRHPWLAQSLGADHEALRKLPPKLQPSASCSAVDQVYSECDGDWTSGGLETSGLRAVSMGLEETPEMMTPTKHTPHLPSGCASAAHSAALGVSTCVATPASAPSRVLQGRLPWGSCTSTVPPHISCYSLSATAALHSEPPASPVSPPLLKLPSMFTEEAKKELHQPHHQQQTACGHSVQAGGIALVAAPVGASLFGSIDWVFGF